MVKKIHTYEYPRPALTTDVIPLRFNKNQLEILLIERAHDPFKGKYALPGGFVDRGESPVEAARRELLEETQVQARGLHEVGSFGAIGRDPRGWVVSVAFIAFLPKDTCAQAGDDARAAQWFSWNELPPLAFDHQEILECATKKLRALTQTSPLPLHLLTPPFRHRHVRYLYSQIWDEVIPPRALKAWLRRAEVLERVGPATYKATEDIRRPWVR